MKQYTFTGKIGTFGGPNDKGVAYDENLAFIYDEDLDDIWFRYLFLDAQPHGTTGLARRLDPDGFYFAARFDYSQTPKSLLRYSVGCLKNLQTGKEVFARPADWGPNVSTKRNLDLSPGAAKYIGAETDVHDVECTLMVPGQESVILPSSKVDIVISIGHHPDGPGVENPASGDTESGYNTVLAHLIAKYCKKVTTRVVQRPHTSWTVADIESTINALKPRYVIELHCNDAESNLASGTEMWAYPDSARGISLGDHLQVAAVNVLGLPDRGVKTSSKFILLKKTKAPCVIVESFFIDNNKDYATGLEQRDALARAYAEVLDTL